MSDKTNLPEAPTAEEAIRLAKELLGPNAVITGARRVLTGGVMGFFATERFVATVQGEDADPAADGRSRDDLGNTLDELESLLGHDPGEAPTAAGANRLIYTRPAGLGDASRSAAGMQAARDAAHGSASAARTVPFTRSMPKATGPSLVPKRGSISSDMARDESTDAPSKPRSGGATGDGFAAALAKMTGDVAVDKAVQTALSKSSASVKADVSLADALRSTSPSTHASPVASLLHSPDAPSSLDSSLAGEVYSDAVLFRLSAMGFPQGFIPEGFSEAVRAKGLHTALTELLASRIPTLASLVDTAGVVMVVGPGVEALGAARTLAPLVRATPTRVMWAAPADLSSIVPPSQRLKTPESAADWCSRPRQAHTPKIIAVSASLSPTMGDWESAFASALSPTAVFAVVDATRKAQDVFDWLGRLPRVDGVMVENASVTRSPGAFLTTPTAPVVTVDGQFASPARWASLLCEQLTHH